MKSSTEATIEDTCHVSRTGSRIHVCGHPERPSELTQNQCVLYKVTGEKMNAHRSISFSVSFTFEEEACY